MAFLFPSQTRNLEESRKIHIWQSAISSVLYSLGTGSFMAGLLSYLGADASVCAIIGSIPQLGCIMQIVAPFFFERLKKRKKYVILCFFLYHLCIGLSCLIPLLIPGASISALLPVYLLGFLIAGFLNPPNNQWIMDLAPVEGRGRYLAKRNNVHTIVNSIAVFLLGLFLDACIERGEAKTGFLILYILFLMITLVDTYMMTTVIEPVENQIKKTKLSDLLLPIKDSKYRPIFVFLVLWLCSQGLSNGFSSIYYLSVLNLSHGFISAMTVAGSLVGIATCWFFGRSADKKGWKSQLIIACILQIAGNVGWFLLPQRFGFLAPVIFCVLSASSSVFNVAFLALQYENCPADRKTIYLGVTAATMYFLYYLMVLLGAKLQPVLANYTDRLGIPYLYLGSAVLFALCSVIGVKTIKENHIHQEA